MPGHARAYKLWLLLVVVLLSTPITNEFGVAAGFALFITGDFFMDHTTHLRQHHGENDGNPPPETAIERWMLKHHIVSRVLGAALLIPGFLILCSYITRIIKIR